MNPDLDYVKLCQRAYNGIPDFSIGNARAYLGLVNSIPTICFPGSRTTIDWALDLLATPALDLDSIDHFKLGLMPLGFLTAVNMISKALNTSAKPKYNICGHSLGGVMAVIYGAEQTVDGNPPNEIVTFNAPRGLTEWGVSALKDVTIRQYRFGADPVSLVPTHPFMHAREPLIQIGKPLSDILANHSLTNFIEPFEAQNG